jgi:hypothetical protein
VAELDLESDTLAVFSAETVYWEVIVFRSVNDEPTDTVTEEVIWLLLETIALIEEVLELWGVFV